MGQPPIEMRLDTLERTCRSLQAQISRTEQLLDVLATPLWKRVWFVLCGWHPYKLDARWWGKR